MDRLMNARRLALMVLMGLGTLAASIGGTCGGGGVDDDLNPMAPPGNRPPRAQITAVITPSNDNLAEQGEQVIIQFTGDDGEDACIVRVFASRFQSPTAAQEVPIASNIPLGPGPGSGQATWNTTGVPVAPYYIFVEISDQTFNPATNAGNPPVRAVWLNTIQIAPPGSRPRNDPPRLFFLEPQANVGLSSEDLMTIRYVYSDTDDPVTVTLLLDKDLNPVNDNINNPGDPLDPNTNIIILPSEPRRDTDPTFDGDPPPPTGPNNPANQADSIQVRTNPRNLGQTAPGVIPPEAPDSPIAGEFKEYICNINFSQIPVRTQPYFIRATVTDGNTTIHSYAVGSLTITALANGVIRMGDVGFSIAGARFHGFASGELLSSIIQGVPDIDGDGLDEMLFGSRYGSPRNRDHSGAAYLIFGRRKTPFPLDTNGNGRPDVIDSNGNLVDFPPPPTFVPNPYDPVNVGRFGGVNSINSVASFFRGTTYGMPEPHGISLPPVELRDPSNPNLRTAGLTSITRIDMTADGVPDLIFGLPFVSAPWDYHDDDPVDGGCDLPYGDAYPNEFRCNANPGNDDIFSPRNGEPYDNGMLILVSGTNDLVNSFRLFTDAAMAGQFDPAGPIDDEGVILPPALIPVGMRMRGGWLDGNDPPIVPGNQFARHVAAVPSLDNDIFDEMIVAVPGFDSGRGKIMIFLSTNLIAGGFYGQGVLSLPGYVSFGCSPGMPTFCRRGFAAVPVWNEIRAAFPGDNFGYPAAANQFNQDGVNDVMFGAPGADRDGLTDNGILYVFFTPAGGFGDTDLATENVPRLEIRGTHNGDRFGEMQTPVRDVNGDGIDDIAFASESFDDDLLGNVNAGYVGVIFGNRPLTGENGFSPNQVGTPQLAGVRFFGPTINARAGHRIDTAGDFNRDGYGDLLISAPGEQRQVNLGDVNGDGQDDFEVRLGVAYLVFGGTHLTNKSFRLSQVGSPELPGIVFISRFVIGSEDEAAIETVGGLGDIDGDGFDDIAIGCPRADFVNPASPNQRRNDAGEIYIIYGNNFGSNSFQVSP